MAVKPKTTNQPTNQIVAFGWPWFLGKVKFGKMSKYKISWKVLKIFAQDCSNFDLGLTLSFLWQG